MPAYDGQKGGNAHTGSGERSGEYAYPRESDAQMKENGRSERGDDEDCDDFLSSWFVGTDRIRLSFLLATPANLLHLAKALCGLTARGGTRVAQKHLSELLIQYGRRWCFSK